MIDAMRNRLSDGDIHARNEREITPEGLKKGGFATVAHDQCHIELGCLYPLGVLVEFGVRVFVFVGTAVLVDSGVFVDVG